MKVIILQWSALLLYSSKSSIEMLRYEFLAEILDCSRLRSTSVFLKSSFVKRGRSAE